MDKVWPEKVQSHYGRNSEKSERWYMINSVEELLKDDKFIQHKDSQNVFELLLYMCGCSERYAHDVYIQYLRKCKNTNQLENVQKITQSNNLVIEIEKLKKGL